MTMKETSKYDMTIVVPVYNEEDNMDMLEQRLGEYLKKSDVKSCVLFVNDGSVDSSLEGIRRICGRNDGFHYISFEKNAGLSAAIKAGMDATESRYVAYIDADLQTDPDDFNLLLPYALEYELVTGVRANRKDSGFKKLQSKIANGFRRRMTGDTARDTGCPLKIMHADVARRLPFFTGMHRFFAALMLLEDGKIKEVDVRHYPRVAGESKFHLWNRLKGPFMDCFAYRWMRRRYIRYRIAEQG